MLSRVRTPSVVYVRCCCLAVSTNQNEGILMQLAKWLNQLSYSEHFCHVYAVRRVPQQPTQTSPQHPISMFSSTRRDALRCVTQISPEAALRNGVWGLFQKAKSGATNMGVATVLSKIHDLEMLARKHLYTLTFDINTWVKVFFMASFTSVSHLLRIFNTCVHENCKYSSETELF